MHRFTASLFGLGRLPVAPGTWGSLPPVIVFGLMCHFHLSPVITSIVMGVLALVGSAICVGFAPTVIAATGRSDPGEVVVDELAGQAATFLVVPLLAIEEISSKQIWGIVVVGFLLFRIFDISKPWPIRRLQKLPAGWGILADDLIASAYAGTVLLLCSSTGIIEYLSESFCFDTSSLNILSAALLGLVQGMTEFLPVSSSGHLVVLETFFQLDPEKPEMLLFDLAVHVGTLCAIFIVFRKSIAAFWMNLREFRRYGHTPTEIYRTCPSVRLFALGAAATIITGISWFFCSDYLLAARGNLTIVSVMWIVTGTLLLVTDSRKQTKLGLRQFNVWHAVVIGLAQAAAMMPGISRSGTTVGAAILLGVRRRWAVEFSFLIAIPAILGATGVQLIQEYGELTSGTLPIRSVVTGFVTAAFIGVFALKTMIKAYKRANLTFFAFYCYILACFVLYYQLR